MFENFYAEAHVSEPFIRYQKSLGEDFLLSNKTILFGEEMFFYVKSVWCDVF